MNKFITFIAAFLLLSTVPVLAVTPTPSPEPTSESVTQKLSSEITDLKEKIASRVAQLKLVEKRGIIGTVKDISGTLITLEDLSGNSRFIDVDEITKFSSPSAKDSYGLSDLKSGVKISIVGLYNKDSQHLLARFIDAYVTPIYTSGLITNVNKTDFTITLSMEEGKSYLVDIENITKIASYTGDTSEKIGFSKVTPGTRAIVIGYADKKEKNRMVASRILLFPSLPKNPKVVEAPNALNMNDAVVSSTGSGKKLTPIK